MKKRVFCIVLSFICTVALLFPTYAQADIVSTKQLAEDTHTHTASCGVSPGFLLIRTEPVATAHDRRAQEELLQLRANAARIDTCTHEEAVLFYDLDIGRYLFVCADCSLRWQPQSADRTEAIQTSVSIRAGCSHEMGDWGYYTDSSHIRECMLCSYYEIEPHDIVAPTCTTNEHCSVCYAAPLGWETAYGHEMGYVFSLEEYFSSGSYVHEYRCIRTNPDVGYTCDYVSSTSSCSMDITYYEPEDNRIHECYNVCNECWATGDIWYEDCPDAIYGGNMCSMCDAPNSWS